LLGVRFVQNILFSNLDEEVKVPFGSYLANLRVCYGRELLLFKEEFTLFIYASPFMNLKSGRIFTLGRDRTGKLFLMLFFTAVQNKL
jgi:hypothetical protein